MQLMAGGTQFVHYREVVRSSECPLLEVSLYLIHNYSLNYQVKVFIDTGGPPYRLSLHTSHNIVPDKCLMKCLTTKVLLNTVYNVVTVSLSMVSG